MGFPYNPDGDAKSCDVDTELSPRSARSLVGGSRTIGNVAREKAAIEQVLKYTDESLSSLEIVVSELFAKFYPVLSEDDDEPSDSVRSPYDGTSQLYRTLQDNLNRVYNTTDHLRRLKNKAEL